MVDELKSAAEYRGLFDICVCTFYKCRLVVFLLET